MGRIFKWLGIALLSLIALFFLAVGVAYLYRDRIYASIRQELKESINGDISIGDIGFNVWAEFPGISVTLQNVVLRGPRYNEFKRDFLTAGKVYVKVQIAPLLRKEIVIHSVRVTRASVFIFRSRSGYVNLDVFKSAAQKDSTERSDPVSVLFRNVRLEDVALAFEDSLKEKSIAFRCIDVEGRISKSDSSTTYNIAGPVHFEDFTLNPHRGSYLKDKHARVSLNLEFVPGTQRLVIHPSRMEFEKSDVDISGIFLFEPRKEFALEIGSGKLDFEEGVSLLTPSLQKKIAPFEVSKPLAIETHLAGLLASPEPDVVVHFSVDATPAKIFKTQIADLSVTGEFSNRMDTARPPGNVNSRVRIPHAQGVYHGFPTSVTATIRNLDDPEIEMKSKMDFPLRKINAMEDSSRLLFEGGTFSSDVFYTGRLKELLDSTATSYLGKLSGTAKVTNGSFQYFPRSQKFRNVNLAVKFDRTHMVIDSVSLLLNKSPIRVKGEISGFIPYFIIPQQKGRVRLSVYSPSLDMEALIAKETTPAPGSRSQSKKKSLSSAIRRWYDRVEFNLDVQVDRLTFQNLRGYNMRGTVTLANNVLGARNFYMRLADGDLAFNLTLANLYSPMSPLYVKGTVRHADIRKFFLAFNDFRMTTLTHDNLEGKIDTDVEFQARLNSNFDVQIPSVVSNVSFSITKGRIQNYEPLQNMSNFLMKRRDFNDVQFGEITSRLSVRGTEVDIGKMEIESTVLRLFLEGRYSLKDSTDLEVQLPLSNLKKRDKDYQPENIGIDSKAGPSVFLHVYSDDNGKTVIAYDPFKKHAHKIPKVRASKKNKSS